MHSMYRLGLAALFLGACHPAPAKPPAKSTAHAEATPSAAWGLPSAEADLSSRRVRGSTVAHVDAAHDKPKDAYVKVAGPFAGKSGERDLPAPSSFSLEQGKCYRLYVQAEPAIRALAVVVQDANGGTVVDESTDIVPQRGAFCADQAGKVEVKLAVGLGQGKWSLEVWAEK